MASILQLALFQLPLIWEEPETNRKAFSKRLDSISEGTDLILLPEMFSTGFTMTPSNIAEEEGPITCEWMREQAVKTRAALCGSLVFRENGAYYNRLYFIGPDGVEYFYDKHHTFTLAGENEVYASGTDKLILSYRGFRICPLICYDLRFPVWSRNVEGYDLLLYVANWPDTRIAAWDTLLKARAIENMAYCAGVNRIGTDANGHRYNGHSAVYDALGNQLVYSEEEAILYAGLELDSLNTTRDSLKFLDDRDAFSLAQ